MALRDNLVAYYAFEENFDDEIHAVNSVPPNTPSLGPDPAVTAFARANSVAGKKSQAVNFDAASSYLLGNDATSLRTGKDKTIAFWFKVSADYGPNPTFIEKSGEYGFKVSVASMRFEVSGDFPSFIINNKVLSVDTWYLAVFWYDFSAATGYLKINNEQPQSGAFTSTVGANGLTIGTPGVTVDELGFWDRILTAAEMSELYNDGAGLTYSDIVPPSQAACREAECCEDDLYAYVAAAGEGKGFNASCEPLPKVIFEPPSGSVLNLPSLVLLRSDNPEAVIHYTTDGSEPDLNSPIYSTAITVETPATLVRAVAVIHGCPTGPESNAQYITWTPAAHFTYACTTTDRSGQWGAFAANGSPDYNWQLQIQFTAVTSVRRFDILQLTAAGEFTGSAWSTKEFITPWEDDISKLHRAFPLVIWIGGVQQNVAYLDDYSGTLGTFGAAAHTLSMYGQPWTALNATDVFKLIVTFADSSTMSRIVDSTCDALPAALCPLPSFTLAPACAPYRIDVTFSLGIGTQFSVNRRVAGTLVPFDQLIIDNVASSPQTFQDTTVAAGVTYEYFMSNIPAGCANPTYSFISTAQAIPNASVSILASPSTIDPAGSSTISWNSSNNNGTVSISPTIGVQPGNVPGNQVVSPAATTTYTITGQNICGTLATAQATVTVNPAATCGASPPATATIQDYHDAFFSSAACTLTAGGTTPWNGQYIRQGIGSCVYKPFQSVTFNLAGGKLLNNVGTSISVSGGAWTLFVIGILGGSNVLVWEGTKPSGDTVLGVYTRTGGCSLTPATLTVV